MTTDPAPVEVPVVTVDPGSVIRINARFPNSPDTVLFSYLPPGRDVAIHDPGAGSFGSEIKQEGDLYHYSIDTRLMRGGLGWWYFVSEDPDPQKRRAKAGKFIVRDVPRALLERNRPALSFESEEEASGLTLLGADSEDAGSAKHVLIGVGVVVGAALLLL